MAVVMLLVVRHANMYSYMHIIICKVRGLSSFKDLGGGGRGVS